MDFVDVKYVADYFGVTERTIQNWTEEWESRGLTPKDGRGNYNFPVIIRLRLKDLENEIEGLKAGDKSLNQEKKEILKITRQEKELKLDKLKNALVDYSLIRDAWCSQLKVIINNMEALGSRITSKLGGDRAMYNEINDMINETRDHIAKTKFEINDYDEIEKVMHEYEEKGTKEDEPD
jgi:phage terminase Nu1 subunit (DNA packaging protein)